jgi:hypothetical protein
MYWDLVALRSKKIESVAFANLLLVPVYIIEHAMLPFFDEENLDPMKGLLWFYLTSKFCLRERISANSHLLNPTRYSLMGIVLFLLIVNCEVLLEKKEFVARISAILSARLCIVNGAEATLVFAPVLVGGGRRRAISTPLETHAISIVRTLGKTSY